MTVDERDNTSIRIEGLEGALKAQRGLYEGVRKQRDDAVDALFRIESYVYGCLGGGGRNAALERIRDLALKGLPIPQHQKDRSR